MKTPLLTFVLATSLAIFSLHADAGDKELKKGQVPQPVLDAFAKARPNAKVKEFEKDTKDGKIVFAIEFKENGIESEYVFSPDGTLLGSGEEIKPAELPPAVAEAIKDLEFNGNRMRIAFFTDPEGYLLEVMQR